MAAANVLTAGTTAASSSDTTVTSDTLFGLKGTGEAVQVFIEVKTDAGAYHLIGQLTHRSSQAHKAGGVSLTSITISVVPPDLLQQTEEPSLARPPQYLPQIGVSRYQPQAGKVC